MLDAYRDLIEELTGTPTAIREALDTGGGQAPATAIALLDELRARDQAVYDRLQTMLRRRDPVLKPLVTAPGSGAATIEPVLADFNAIRGELVSLLMNLTLRDWERTAIAETGEEVVLADEVERHVEADEELRARIIAAITA